MVKQDRSYYDFFRGLSRSLLTMGILFLILFLGRHIFIPLAFACLFALLLAAPCSYLERRRFSRGLTSTFAVVLIVSTGLALSYFISSRLIHLRADLSQLASQLHVIISPGAGNWLHAYAVSALPDSGTLLHGTVIFLSGTVTNLILIPVYTFLLLYYRGLILRFLIMHFGEMHEKRIRRLVDKARSVINGYVGGLLIEMLIVASLNIAGFFIIGMKYAILFGLIVAVLNLIPYIGIFISCALSLLITLPYGSSIMAVKMIIVLLSIHLADAYLIFPSVVGWKVKINALAALSGVLAGWIIWGIPGMFLALPSIAMLKTLFDEFEGLRDWGLLLGGL
ncbi:MAG: AI-2E family transporter [Bacteroidota bacterium]|nr:AI-2E family transporter [Bacteroidota bacterium]MDP4255515.1 AI-2E family transporter [Bacteroidota bacterium]MDP4257776.1 AI-2E family transporter [Bacteroidota bacterium]